MTQKNYLNLIKKEISIKVYLIIFASMMIGLFFFIFFAYTSNKFNNKEKILINEINNLEKQYQFSQTTIDQLNKKNAKLEQALQSCPCPPVLKINNIDDPISYLKKDLMKRKNLIPYKGVLGGTMGFYDENNIHVLNRRWVYAHFEDGHIGGQILLEYDILKDGKINWKVIDAFKIK
jgi:hypothetical protein